MRARRFLSAAGTLASVTGFLVVLVALAGAFIPAAVAAQARLTGAHVCRADGDASGAPTAESSGRAGIQVPPAWFAFVEATDTAAREPLLRGRCLLEHVRGKTGFAA